MEVQENCKITWKKEAWHRFEASKIEYNSTN